MIPLVFILTVTGIKDGIEDYRRSVQDDIVNNSAAISLSHSPSSFTNPNVPKDGREWWEKLFGFGQSPGGVSKGVKRLRRKDGDLDLSNLTRGSKAGQSSVELLSGHGHDDEEHGFRGGGGLEDIGGSIDSHSYPPSSVGSKAGLLSSSTVDAGGGVGGGRSMSMSQVALGGMGGTCKFLFHLRSFLVSNPLQQQRPTLHGNERYGRNLKWGMWFS